MRRHRKAKIVATLGPASTTPRAICARCSMPASTCSGSISATARHDDHRAAVRRPSGRSRAETGRPIGILVDLQGPKLRVGDFAGRQVELTAGQPLPPRPRRRRRATRSARRCRIPEIFDALEPGTDLLLDDGKVRLRVERLRRRFRRDRGRGRRHAVGPQGRQRAGRGAADLGADREGPRRPALRARARRRLDRAVLRAAARRRRRGAQADRRPRRGAGQAREAGGDRAARRDHRAGRRA